MRRSNSATNRSSGDGSVVRLTRTGITHTSRASARAISNAHEVVGIIARRFPPASVCVSQCRPIIALRRCCTRIMTTLPDRLADRLARLHAARDVHEDRIRPNRALR